MYYYAVTFKVIGFHPEALYIYIYVLLQEKQLNC